MLLRFSSVWVKSGYKGGRTIPICHTIARSLDKNPTKFWPTIHSPSLDEVILRPLLSGHEHTRTHTHTHTLTALV